MKIFLGADHAGFYLKKKIKFFLDKLSADYEDLGNLKFGPKDDYPDFAKKVAQKVAQTQSRGILLCSSGVGMCIVANKAKGIRAVNAWNVKVAKHSREHNNTNILCLPGSFLTEKEVQEIIRVWLKTPFSKAPRHRRRVRKVKKIEEEG